MRKRHMRLILSAGMALMLVLIAGGQVLAATWYSNGKRLDGTTNPIDHYTNTGMNQSYYRAASFSQIFEYSYWVGVQNQAGDWCSGGGGGFPKQSTSWNWQVNQPNVWHSAMTGWTLGSNCSAGHTYLVRGTHNIHGAGVDYDNTTDAP